MTSNTRTAVITGATGGIGEALAEQLATDGWRLALVGRNAEALERLTLKLRNTANGQIDTFTADLASRASRQDVISQILERFTQLDALMNVAGVLFDTPRPGPGGVDLHLEVNVLAALHMANGLRPALSLAGRSGQRSVIVNVSSSAISMTGKLNVDALPAPRKGGILGAYGQSKLALTVATSVMATDYAAEGIDVFAVDPGGNRTRMTSDAGAPFFIRWMQWALPKPQKGALLLAKPLKGSQFAKSGDLIVNGKTKPLPKGALDEEKVSNLRKLMQANLGYRF